MLNLPNSSSGSFEDLLKRMNRSVQNNKTDDQVLQLLQQVFEMELGKESMILSRPERVRLFQQVTKTILSDVQQKIDDAK